MLRYIIADLKRILLRGPRTLALLFTYFFGIISMFGAHKSGNWNSVAMVSWMDQFTAIMLIMLGVIEIFAVYGDDFKAKSMQVAIGVGISRKKIVFSKMMEMVILVLVDIVVGVLIMIAFGCGVFHTEIRPEQVGEICAMYSAVWLYTMACASLAIVLAFVVQGTALSAILYLLFALGVVDGSIGALLNLKWIKELHLTQFQLTSLFDVFKARLILGTFRWGEFIGILIYLAIGFVATMLLFEKRELEF